MLQTKQICNNLDKMISKLCISVKKYDSMKAKVCMSVHFLKLKSVFMVLGVVIKKWMYDEQLQVDNCCVVVDDGFVSGADIITVL